jgi:hypothetical protein
MAAAGAGQLTRGIQLTVLWCATPLCRIDPGCCPLGTEVRWATFSQADCRSDAARRSRRISPCAAIHASLWVRCRLPLMIRWP